MKTIKTSVFTTGEMKEFDVEKISHFRPGAYGIVIHENKILLLHNRNNPGLSLPGGGIDLGETNEEALKREMIEETGLQVQIDRYLAFDQDFLYYDPVDELYHTFLFFYACTPITFDLLPDDQIDDDESERPRWFPIDSLKPDQLVSHGAEILNFAKTGKWQ